MEVLVVFLGLMAVMVGLFALRGWILSIMWGWFVAGPTNLDMPEIDVCQAIGLSLLVGLLTSSRNHAQQEAYPDEWYDYVISGVAWFILLGVGWFFKH